MKTIGIINEKGGVSKTTTTINLAYGFAQKGLNVLICDLDPQGNTTNNVLRLNDQIDQKELVKINEDFNESDKTVMDATRILNHYTSVTAFSKDISDVLLDHKIVRDAIINVAEYTNYDGDDEAFSRINILPSSLKLAEVDLKLKQSWHFVEQKLKLALDHIRNEFDVCIIDNSPYTNSLTYNTMNACCKEGDIILIPTKIDNYSIVGLSKTVHMMMEWLQAMPLGFDFKILLTMVNRNKTEKCMVETIQNLFRERCLKQTIRHQSKPVTEANLNKEILLATSNSPVAEDYKKVVDELYREEFK